MTCSRPCTCASSPSSSCECSPGSTTTHDFGPGPVGKPTPLNLSSGFEECYRPATIDTGDLRKVVYWRVASFDDGWVKGVPGAPEPVGRTVSTRRVTKLVEEMLAADPWTITIQKQP